MTTRFKKLLNGALRWSHTDFDVGDMVSVSSHDFDTLSWGTRFVVTGVAYQPTHDHEHVGLPGEERSYQPVYRQNLSLEGRTRPYSAKNFSLVTKRIVPMSQIHSIEERKPCRAREVHDEDGRDVEFGEYLEFDTMPQLKSAVSKLISGTIREKNEYQRFHIYRYDSVAGAKEPEIEFK